MKSIMIRHAKFGLICTLFAAYLFVLRAEAQVLPSVDDFDAEIQACLAEKKIALQKYQIEPLTHVYSVTSRYGAPSFTSRQRFESHFEPLLVKETQRVYSECVSRIVAPRALQTPPQERECMLQYNMSRTDAGQELIAPLDCPKLSEVVGTVQVFPIYLCSRAQYEIKVDPTTGYPAALRIVPSVACLVDQNAGGNGCQKTRGTCFKLKYYTLS
ncbi:hypothetical protein [Bradyrhizobium diversitatis]|uniref:Uncharacterized protein n=1 Tax=Bradyrhizobium diversitatis TaxID=2755406 RepID=A0ABS0PGG7_9BRAD|nr:hypothetical protein [Bradyrhizobium diversitatis]MBH5392087.1 hypothetical protein [Bradyrhizobium diversitatis]